MEDGGYFGKNINLRKQGIEILSEGNAHPLLPFLDPQQLLSTIKFTIVLYTLNM